MGIKAYTINIAILFFIYLFLVRIVDNDIFGIWENTHISQGIWGSWIWVLIKFSYWCIPIISYLLLRHKLTEYIKEKFNLHIKPSFSLLFIPLWLIALLIENHFRVPTRDLTYFHLVNSVITIPFIEEFVFRGFILDKLLENSSFYKANLYQSILFALIHLPYYYELGKFNNPGLLIGNLLYLALFAYISGYLAKTNKSLFPSILLHAINNLLT